MKCWAVQWVKKHTHFSNYAMKNKQKLLCLWLGQAKDSIRLTGQENKPLPPERRVALEETPGKAVCRRRTKLLSVREFQWALKKTKTSYRWFQEGHRQGEYLSLLQNSSYTHPTKEWCQKWKIVLLQQPPLTLTGSLTDHRSTLDVQQEISTGVFTAPLETMM